MAANTRRQKKGTHVCRFKWNCVRNEESVGSIMSYVYMTLHLPPFRSPQNSPGSHRLRLSHDKLEGLSTYSRVVEAGAIRQATHVVDPPTRRPGNRWPVSQTWVVCWTANLFFIFLDKPTRFCRSPINGTGMKRLWPCLTKSPS